MCIRDRSAQRNLETIPTTEKTLGERALEALVRRTSNYGVATYTATGAGPYSGQQPAVVAICTEPLLPVELIGRAARSEDAAVIVAHLPVRLKAMTGTIVPNWAIARRIAETRTFGGGSIREETSGGSTEVQIQNASVTWELKVPTGPEGVTPVGLQLLFHSSGSLTGNAIEVFSFERGRWDSIPSKGGYNITLSPPEKYMSADGRVLVRVASQGSVTVSSIGLRARVDAW